MTQSKNQFRDYVTSSAFNLSLSQRQIDILLLLQDTESDVIAWYSHSDMTLGALKRKGLITRENDNGTKWPMLTEAGKCASEMLLCAGFTAENAYVRIVA